MTAQNLLKWTSTALLALLLSGCATRTVVKPVPVHAHHHTKTHVVYHVKPAKRHCWRHNGHWDCRPH